MVHLVLPIMLLALASGCAAFLPLVWQCGGGPVYHVSFEGAPCLVQFLHFIHRSAACHQLCPTYFTSFQPALLCSSCLHTFLLKEEQPDCTPTAVS